MKHFKISFCTAVMNRLHHLKRTLPQNISDNHNYGEVEFVILDYNSSDGLEEWVQNVMTEHIENGTISYYRTSDPSFFHRSHSRNMVFKLAKGDIVCNLDADNYTGKGFAAFINEQFNENEQIVLTCIDFRSTQKNYHPPSDVLGRIAVKKDNFLKVRGYYEEMSTHGFQDYDFVNRLDLSGLKREFIKEEEFLHAIKHDDVERFSESTVYKELDKFLLYHHTPSETVCLFLFKNGSFHSGTLVDNSTVKASEVQHSYQERTYHFIFSMKEENWMSGKWITDNKIISLSFSKGNELKLKLAEDNCYEYFNEQQQLIMQFYQINDFYMIKNAVMLNSQLSNRNIMFNNWLNKRIVVNKETFGAGTAYRNFDYSNPISL